MGHSVLLINEPPLQVLPSLASLIGLNEAIVLQQVHYWLNNPKVGREHDGRRWIYNSVREWQRDNFPFWSDDTIQRTLAKLRNLGLLIAINLNDSQYDRTLWYTIDYDRLDSLLEEQKAITADSGSPLPQSAVIDDRKLRSGEVQDAVIDHGKMHQPIPEINTETTQIEKTQTVALDTSTWDAIKKHIQMEMTKATFDELLSRARFEGIDEDVCVIGVPNQRQADWVNNRLGDVLTRTILAFTGQNLRVWARPFPLARSKSATSRPARVG